MSLVARFAKLAYADSQVRQGEKVEAEHAGTVDWLKQHPDVPKRVIFRHIAKDHLRESGRYYRDLKTMEEFEDQEKRAFWMGDHVKMTEQAMAHLRERGIKFTPAQIKRLADSNYRADVDNDLRFGLSSKRTPFHYFANKEEQAKNLISHYQQLALKAKNTDEAMDALGIATHTQQDQFSHADLKVPAGLRGALMHLSRLRPDSAEKHPEQVEKAVRRTEEMLADYVQAGGKLGRVTDAEPYHRAVLQRADDFLKQAQVDPYQQLTQWTCSAACLRAVLLHWGQDWPESILVPLIGARPKRGAETTEIAEAARMLGFMAFEYSFATVEHARVLLEQDIPIICDIQSFKKPGSGHYVVFTHLDEEGVHLMDPNIPEAGNQRTISLEEMEGRWWDHAMAPPHDLMERWGVVVLPAE